MPDDKEIEEFIEEYGDALPDPEQYPKSLHIISSYTSGIKNKKQEKIINKIRLC